MDAAEIGVGFGFERKIAAGRKRPLKEGKIPSAKSDVDESNLNSPRRHEKTRKGPNASAALREAHSSPKR
jgi:hypothetical protein